MPPVSPQNDSSILDGIDRLTQEIANLNKHYSTWVTEIKADLEYVVNRNWELEKQVATLAVEAIQRDKRIEALEETFTLATRTECLRQIDDEAQTLMLSGFNRTILQSTDEPHDLLNHLTTQLPSLHKDLSLHRPFISFNNRDAKNRTAFLKFSTKDAAFSTAKNFATCPNKKSMSLRSCIPKDIRDLKDKLRNDFQNSPLNKGWICSYSLGRGRDRHLLIGRKAKDPGRGKNVTGQWKDFNKVDICQPKKLTPPPTPEDPIHYTLRCSKLPETPSDLLVTSASS